MNLSLPQWISRKKKNKGQLDKYFFHKKAFPVTDSPNLLHFEQYVLQNEPYTLECACKIGPRGVFSRRFNAAYKSEGDQNQKVATILAFLREYSEKTDVLLDKNLLEQLARALMYIGVVQFFFAVDITERKEDSKLRLGLVVCGDLRNVIRLLDPYKRSGFYEFLKRSIRVGNLFCAYDLYSDGRSAAKIYLPFRGNQLNYLLESKTISESEGIRDFINRSWAFHLAFKNAPAEKSFYFRPLSEEGFIKHLNSDTISDVYAKTSSCPYKSGLIVGLSEKEILSGKIENANIYY